MAGLAGAVLPTWGCTSIPMVGRTIAIRFRVGCAVVLLVCAGDLSDGAGGCRGAIPVDSRDGARAFGRQMPPALLRVVVRVEPTQDSVVRTFGEQSALTVLPVGRREATRADNRWL